MVFTHPYSLSKVFNSLWMGPYLVYFSMSNWIYPLADYIGETGCYLMNIFRAVHLYEVQLQSFFISLFRFVCLFHAGFLQKIKLSPNVRDKGPSHLYLIFEKSSLTNWIFNLQKSISKLIFADYTSRKNPVRQTYNTYSKASFYSIIVPWKNIA